MVEHRDNDDVRRFEAAIEAAFEAGCGDDPAPYLVYADWLQVQGDPLGELIVLQHRLTQAMDQPSRERIVAHVQELLSVHHHRFLGGLADVEGIDSHWYDWSNGFLYSLEVSTHLGAELFEGLASSRGARFLRQLDVSLQSKPPISAAWDDGIEVTDPISSIEQHGFPQTVRKLHFSLDTSFLGYTPAPRDYSTLYKHWQHLEELGINPPDVLGTMDLPRLKHLQLNNFRAESFVQLATAQLPSVQSLDISNHYDEWNLLHGFPTDALPKLHRLRLSTWTKAGDEAIRTLTNLPLLRKAKALDLDYVLSETGTAELIKQIRTFDHLEEISLRNAPFTSAEEAIIVSVFGDRVTLEKL